MLIREIESMIKDKIVEELKFNYNNHQHSGVFFIMLTRLELLLLFLATATKLGPVECWR